MSELVTLEQAPHDGPIVLGLPGATNGDELPEVARW
jgi:hypothetical protein